MQIKLNLQRVNIPKMKSIQPVVCISGTYTANSVREKEPVEWFLPICAKTVMAVGGSRMMCPTFLENYFGREYYVYSRATSF